MLLIGTGIFVYVILNWSVLNAYTKFVAAFYIILPLHVIEEWRIPGGFHYNYNVTMKSKTPDRFPMNQLTDMLTNFLAEMIGIIILFFGVNQLIAIWHIFFCATEMIIHSLFGRMMYHRFKIVGKHTWYNPGYITAIFFFLTAVCATFFIIPTSFPSALEWFIGLTLFLIEMAIIILIPEQLFKSPDTLYPFSGKYKYGYYIKFVEKYDELQ